jgi:hypothetical protein
MQCVWELAEETARAMGADTVRIDIFVTPGKPGCLLNEISLSSAHLCAHACAIACVAPCVSCAGRRGRVCACVHSYERHDEFIAKLWTMPELRQQAYRNAMGEPAASTPVYKLTSRIREREAAQAAQARQRSHPV